MMSRFFGIFCLLAGILIFNVEHLYAQTPCTWTGAAGGTNWSNATNWSCGHVPTASDDVVINSGASMVMSLASAGGINLRSLSISGRTVEFGNNFNNLTINGSSVIGGVITDVYTLKMSSSTLNVQNASFTMAVNGPSPVNITSSTLGNITTSSTVYYPVQITNGRTTGNDGTGQTLIISGTSFLGDFTSTANCFKFTNNTFSKTVSITKSSSSPEVLSVNNSGNIFNSTTTLTNNSTTDGDVSWGNGDVFNSATAVVNINNNSSGIFYIASSTTSPNTNATFKGPVNFTIGSGPSSSGKIILANTTSNAVNFSPDVPAALTNVYFYNNSTTTSPKAEIQISNAGSVTFDYSNVYLGCSGGYIYTGYTAGVSNQVLVTGNSKFSVAPSGISIPVFTAGELHLDRLNLDVNTNSYTSNFSMGGTSAINMKSGVIGSRPVNVNAKRIIGIGGTYNKATTFTLLSGSSTQQTDTYSAASPVNAQLNFKSDISFINAASATWTIGGSGTSTLSNNVINFSSPAPPTRSAFLIQTNSNGDIIFGTYPCTINISNSNFKIRRDVTSASIYMGFKSNTNVTSSDLSNANLRTDLTLEESGDVSMYNFAISLGSANAGTDYGTFTFNGVLNTTGFVGGNVIFGRFTANNDINITAGASPHATTLITISQYAVFSKNSYFKAPNIVSTGGLFGAAPLTAPPLIPSSYTWTSTIWRTAGAVATNPNYFTGTPTFNGIVNIYNESSESFIFGNTTSDIFTFNSNVVMYRYGTGELKTSGLGKSYYKGNYNYTGSPSTTAMVGESIFTGLIDQSIYCNSVTLPLIFNVLEVTKPAPISPALLNDVVLGSSVSVGASGQLKLNYGNIRTTSTALLSLENLAVIIGGSANSFVEGPLRKNGLIPTVTPNEFKFQIGKTIVYSSTSLGRIYMPLTISMPVSTTSSYTAEFFNQNQTTSNILGSGIADVQSCQYWRLIQNGSVESIAVTLPWDNNVGQTCYPVNSNVVCVAQYQGASQWLNVGNSVTTSSGVTGTVKSSVLNNIGSYTDFSLGYLNALIIDTRATNKEPFTITGGCEPFPVGTSFTSSSFGNYSGTKTIISNSVNITPGFVVIHPNFNSVVDLAITTNTDFNSNLPLTIKVYTSAVNTAVVSAVKTDEGNGAGLNDMSTNYYKASTNQLIFYKSKPDDATLNNFSINLADGVTFLINKYLSTNTTPFIIQGVPAAVTSPLLKIYDNQGNLVTQNSSLSWDGFGTLTPYVGLLCPEGLYPYVLSFIAGGQTYTYKSQLIIKYQ